MKHSTTQTAALHALNITKYHELLLRKQLLSLPVLPALTEIQQIFSFVLSETSVNQ